MHVINEYKESKVTNILQQHKSIFYVEHKYSKLATIHQYKQDVRYITKIYSVRHSSPQNWNILIYTWTKSDHFQHVVAKNDFWHFCDFHVLNLLTSKMYWGNRGTTTKTYWSLLEVEVTWTILETDRQSNRQTGSQTKQRQPTSVNRGWVKSHPKLPPYWQIYFFNAQHTCT